MFDLIHEFAVLGTTFFMMALATVWYSPMLFGKAWMRETGVTDEMVEKMQPHMWKHMLLTFVSYAGMLVFLALLVVYAPILGFVVWKAAAAVALFVALTAVAPTLFEGRSLTYYAIRVGFYVVFIVSGTLMLQYWPW
tara:strand:+ start:113 stop:523 length:411 start_codon:yes stop_codon:yes gene_type:complete